MPRESQHFGVIPIIPTIVQFYKEQTMLKQQNSSHLSDSNILRGHVLCPGALCHTLTRPLETSASSQCFRARLRLSSLLSTRWCLYRLSSLPEGLQLPQTELSVRPTDPLFCIFSFLSGGITAFALNIRVTLNTLTPHTSSPILEVTTCKKTD